MHQQARYISISELTKLLNVALAEVAGNLACEGEISEFTRAASGHVYGVLKDEQAQINFVIWAPLARTLNFKLEAGLQVRCMARATIYPKSGRLQVVITSIMPAGEGALQRKFLQLKAKLEAEGLFRPERKRALPFFPKAVGLVTSATGAAIQDMLVKFQERMPHLSLFLVDVRVQGEGAAVEIAGAIHYLANSGMVDVIITGRGGGSLEDLWAFNEEVVVRAIFASAVPVVSAVGHEVDVSLSDLVADARAPTPTAAVEMVIPRRSDLLKMISEFERRLMDTDRWFMPLEQRVDELWLSLSQRMTVFLESEKLKLKAWDGKLKSIEPSKVVELMRSRVGLLAQRLSSAMRQKVTGAQGLIDKLGAHLEAVSPQRVLERGFSIVESNGTVIRQETQVQVEQPLSIRLWKGKLTAVVTRKGKS